METKPLSNAKKLLFATLIGAVMGLLSSLSGIAALALPMFLAFIFICWGNTAALLCLLACIGASFGLGGTPALIIMLGCGLPGAIVIAYTIKKQLPWRTAVIITSFLFGIGLFARFCGASLLAGEDAFAHIKSVAVTLMEELDAAAKELPVDAKAGQFITLFSAMLPGMIPSLAITAISSFAMLFGLLNVFFARMFAFKFGYADLRPMAPMQLWQLSKNFKYAACAMAVGALITTLAKLNNADAVVALAEQVICGPLALMGFCYLDFSTRLGRPGSKTRRTIIYILIVILPYRTTVLAVIGLMDRALKFRRKYMPNTKKK